ncbi:MAG: tetratricopeptide repeat protein [Armatimonadota bacterium]
MSATARRSLLALLVPLFALVVWLQVQMDPMRKRYQPGKVTNIEIGTQFVAATLIGLKEVVAGLLWVRADEFFHSGNYAAVIPIVRIVTWLDPHQIDVYDTGAWHLSYNFTDSQERSDRRYIPPAQALYREGIANNPDIYDLYFAQGWMNFHKVLDFKKAIEAFTEANKRPAVDPSTGKKRMRPQFVGHTLAHAYRKDGQIDRAIEQWRQNIKDNERYVRESGDPGEQVMVDVARNNLNQLLREKEERSRLKPVKDVKFEAQWQFLGPRKFRVFGTLDLPTGARVRLVLRDKNFKEQEFQKFSWDIDTNQTILIDDLYVKDGRFSRTIDIERDVSIYPLKAEEYVMTFTFNPLTAPDFVQDVVGFKGEGLADQKYLVVRNGVRMLEKSFIIKRNQLL